MTLKELARKIENLFSTGELQDLCFHLDIDFDNLKGETKKEKSRELVSYCNRHDKLNDLTSQCKQLRPTESWELDDETLSIIQPVTNQTTIVNKAKKSPRNIIYGIAALVIAIVAVVLVYGLFFRPSDVELAVRLADSQNQPISGAEILLFYEGGPFNQVSDDKGVGFFLAESSRANVQLIAQANGYKIEEQTIRLNRDQNITLRLNDSDEDNHSIIIRVLDNSTKEPVDAVEVRLIINGDTFSESTDSNGLAKFILEFTSETIEADISVESNAHQIENQLITLRPEQVQDILLESNAIVGVNSINSINRSNLRGSTATSNGQHNVNLVLNPSNEEALINGEIPSWDKVTGINWGQNNEVPVYDGLAYFDAGEAGTIAELKQDIDISAFASEIDEGRQDFEFSAFLRSFPPQLFVPVDSSTVIIEFFDDSRSNIIDSFATEESFSTDQWFEISDTITAPENSRWVRIRLISTKYGGYDSDGYFDSISLIALPQN